MSHLSRPYFSYDIASFQFGCSLRYLHLHEVTTSLLPARNTFPMNRETVGTPATSSRLNPPFAGIAAFLPYLIHKDLAKAVHDSSPFLLNVLRLGNSRHFLYIIELRRRTATDKLQTRLSRTYRYTVPFPRHSPVHES